MSKLKNLKTLKENGKIKPNILKGLYL